MQAVTTPEAEQPNATVQPQSGGGSFVPEIESLRGVAISLVFLYHVFGRVTRIPERADISGLASPLRAYMQAGHTGVSLFFVLSGFLLARPFLLEAAGGRRVDRRRYFERRALRILPLYWVTVVTTTILVAQRPADLLRGLPYLAFLNSVPPFMTLLYPHGGVWWSLATEVQFYLFLPLLPYLLQSSRGRWLGVFSVLAYAATYIAFLMSRLPLDSPDALWAFSHSLFGRAPLFAYGVIASWLCLRWGDSVRAWAANRVWLIHGGSDLALLSVVLSLGLLLRSTVPRGYAAEEMYRSYWHLPEGVLWTTILLLVVLAPLRMKWLFSNRIWSALGLISYSIYLIHHPLLIFGFAHAPAGAGAAAGWSLATLATTVVMGGLCVGLSALSYLLIERPFLQRKALLE